MSSLKRTVFIGGVISCCMCFSLFVAFAGFRPSAIVFRTISFRNWDINADAHNSRRVLTDRRLLTVNRGITNDARGSNARVSEPNTEQSRLIQTYINRSSKYASLGRDGSSTRAASKKALLHTDGRVYTTARAPDAPGSVNHGCSTRHNVTTVEDILCMNRPNFTSGYRNPCWYEGHGWRRRLRCLPYFHIIGVCKTGTTDLFRRLTYHPHILANRGILGKETWYWTWQRYGHSNFYKKLISPMKFTEFIDMFDTSAISASRNRGNGSRTFYPTITGHGDPMDFWDQTSWREIPQNDVTKLEPDVTTPDLIKHVNPNVKLILLLRDPVHRLFSNYLHGKFGTNSAHFHNDVMATLKALKSCTQAVSIRACLYSRDLHKLLKVPISASFYSVHLKEWLRAFPRKQIFILRTEDFSSDVAGSLQKIFRFLELENIPTNELYRLANMPHFYGTALKSQAGAIMNETRDALEEMFAPYNRELATLLNDEKYLWRRSADSNISLGPG